MLEHLTAEAEVVEQTDRAGAPVRVALDAGEDQRLVAAPALAPSQELLGARLDHVVHRRREGSAPLSLRRRRGPVVRWDRKSWNGDGQGSNQFEGTGVESPVSGGRVSAEVTEVLGAEV